MRHDWIDSSGNDRPFRRFRKCKSCGVEQEHHTEYEWMRVVGYRWLPLVGRCKGKEGGKGRSTKDQKAVNNSYEQDQKSMAGLKGRKKMVYIDQLAGKQSQHIESRVKHCSVERVAPAEYRVSPEGKDDRRVQFGLVGERGIAVCADWNTGEECDANKRGRACCHCVKAYRDFVGSIEQEAA